MLGFLIGAVCLVALLVLLQRERRSRWGTAWWRDEPMGPQWGRCRWGSFHEGPIRHLFRRLDTTPGQEKVIRPLVDEVVDAVRTTHDEIRGSRTDVARAISADPLDEGALRAAWARQDQAVARLREVLQRALSTTHEALDERQRRTLAEIVAEGPHGFGPGFRHPYRD